MSSTNKTPTMKDVATTAGVSLGTVSKVFNGIPVGEEYRIKVLKAAEQLDYQLNAYARGLRSNKTYTVAVILPTLVTPFFAELADLCCQALRKRNYRTLLATTLYDLRQEQECVDLVQQNKVDGIIAITYNPDLEINEDIPFVIIDRKFNTLVPCVSCDNFSGGALAAEKLIENGCRNLLFVGTFSHVSGEVDKRPLGFESYCRSQNITPTLYKVYDEEGPNAIIQFIDQQIEDGKFKFDGIFCNTDTIAILVIEHLTKLGISIPDDVQIIGFDGIRKPGSDNYFCSTIRQPLEAMAEAAVDIVLSENKNMRPALLCLPVSFEYGGTTKNNN